MLLHAAMLPILLAAWVWVPRVDAMGEVGYDLATDDGLRASIRLGLEVALVEGADWQLQIFTEARTFVRENDRRHETLFRISPEQIHYPVGARLRFDLGDGFGWGLVAFHQSNHDVDSTDERLARETLAYEIYGAEWSSPWGRLWGGLFYDRGTRLDGTRQSLPFDYYLGGLIAESERPVWGPLYAGGRLALVAHRNADHAPAHLDLDGWLDAGWRLDGPGGVWRVFARFQRIENYRYLGDTPRHLLLLGTALGTR